MEVYGLIHSEGFKRRNVMLVVCLNYTINNYSIQNVCYLGCTDLFGGTTFLGRLTLRHYITTVPGEVPLRKENIFNFI